MKSFILCIASMLISTMVIAQNCDCQLTEVENNTVSSCNYTIGRVVTVSTTSAFIDAVNLANNTGGNMTILIADGTYQVASTSWYPYITANNVVFRSLSGDRDAVILTGNGMVDVAPNTEIGIYAVGDNITIADLTIKDVGNHGISVTGDNLYVYNVKIQNTYEQMIKGNNTGNGIDNGIVKCSLFEYTNGVGPQWYIGGLDIHSGTNWKVSDNVFKDISSPSDAIAEHAIHFWDTSSDNVIERNKIVNCDRGIGFGLGSSPNSGGIIKNNMITNDGSNVFDDVGISLETSPNTKIYNNSIYIDYPNAIEYRFAATTNVEIINNLSNKIIKSRNGGTATLASNNTEALNAWFVSTTTGDLRLVGDISAVVDKGTNLANVTKDIDKQMRPQFLNHDIGAFEFPNPLSIDDDIQDKKYITVYPTLSANQITLKSSFEDVFSVVIYNSLGQKMNNFTHVNLFNGLAIDVSNWSGGVHYCMVTSTNNYRETVKMIIVK